MQLGYGGYQGKPQAVPRLRPASLAAVKTLEQFVMFLTRYTGAVIAYRDERPFIGTRQQKRNVCSLGCMKNRNLDQVGEKLNDQGPVAADGGLGLQLQFQMMPAGFGDRAEHVPHMGQKRPQRDRGKVGAAR